MHGVRSPRSDARPPSPDSSRGRHAALSRKLRRPWAVAVAIAGVIGLCAGVAGLIWAHHTARPATPIGHFAITPIPKGHYAAAPQAAQGPAVAKPVSLDIPAIGVQTRLIRLGLTSSGAMQVPSTTSVAGWYTGSPRPGAVGAAVIVGHIDSVSGPGIFFRLPLMKPGELIYVRRANHSLAVFRVTAVHQYLKAAFPTSAVYGAVPDAQLRLITCGGAFDFATGHYLSNTIVFATLRS